MWMPLHRCGSLEPLVRCADVVKFHRRINSFFIKDDHDTLTNDSIPGQSVGNLTWDDGLAIFKEHTDRRTRLSYAALEQRSWIVEGRDYRPEPWPDGEGKSIFGPEQKEWFMESVRASDAPFKILFSPHRSSTRIAKIRKTITPIPIGLTKGRIRQFCARTMLSLSAVTNGSITVSMTKLVT